MLVAEASTVKTGMTVDDAAINVLPTRAASDCICAVNVDDKILSSI